MKFLMKTVQMVVLMIAAQSPAAAEGWIGLLTLPQVLGEGACDRFTPEEVPYYGEPDGDEPVATIRVEQYWEFPPEGGCMGLRVTAGAAQADEPGAELPTMEYDYEMPAAIV